MMLDQGDARQVDVELQALDDIVTSCREHGEEKVKRDNERQKKKLEAAKAKKKHSSGDSRHSSGGSTSGSDDASSDTSSPSSPRGKPYGYHHEFRCVTCNAFAFKSKRVFRVYPKAQSHVVLDPSLYCRTKTWPYPREDSDDCLEMIIGDTCWTRHLKLSCNKCGRQWGNVSYNKYGSILPFIKLICFTLIDAVGHGECYEFWKDVPVKWPVLREHEEWSYLKEVQFLRFPGAYDLSGEVTSKGTSLKSFGCGVTVVAVKDAVPSGQSVYIQADTKAHCSYLHEELKSKTTNESVVTSTIQFHPVDLGNNNNRFNKPICIRVKHTAKKASNIKVYKCDNRESEFFEEIPNTIHQDDDFYLADSKTVYIFTKNLKCYVCTEQDGADQVKTSTSKTISVFTSQQQGVVNVEVYCSDVALISKQNLMNWIDAQNRRGFQVLGSEETCIGKGVEKSDIITMSAIYTRKPKEQWLHATSQDQCQVHTASEAFCLDSVDSASKKVVMPRRIGTYRMLPKYPNQKFMGIKLILCRYKENDFDFALPEKKRQGFCTTKNYFEAVIPLAQGKF